MDALSEEYKMSKDGNQQSNTYQPLDQLNIHVDKRHIVINRRNGTGIRNSLIFNNITFTFDQKLFPTRARHIAWPWCLRIDIVLIQILQASFMQSHVNMPQALFARVEFQLDPRDGKEVDNGHAERACQVDQRAQ